MLFENFDSICTFSHLELSLSVSGDNERWQDQANQEEEMIADDDEGVSQMHLLENHDRSELKRLSSDLRLNTHCVSFKKSRSLCHRSDSLNSCMHHVYSLEDPDHVLGLQHMPGPFG